jgi:hypothetical protein
MRALFVEFLRENQPTFAIFTNLWQTDVALRMLKAYCFK